MLCKIVLRSVPLELPNELVLFNKDKVGKLSQLTHHPPHVTILFEASGH